MEEVPPSPEIVKRKKLRRKHGTSFSRLSFQHSSFNSAPADRSTEPFLDESAKPQQTAEDVPNSPQWDKGAGHSRIPKISAFYFDDGNSEPIETVDANPLTSAILLEKANAIAVQSKAPSADFVAATNEQFMTVAELAKRNSAFNQPIKPDEQGKANAKKHNYSFTQLELDSQMLGIFEAAELIACPVKDDEQVKPLENRIGETDVEVRLNLPPSETDNIQKNNSLSQRSDENRERTTLQTILDDFTEPDDGFSWEVDYSVIRTESIRQRLRQLQDYIASPPKAVKKEPGCRRYGNAARRRKEPIARRLSYETDGSSRIDGQPLTDDELGASSETDVPDSEGDISMDGVALDSSVLIQANLTQLSAFFSQAIVSQTYGEEGPRKDENDETGSIDREPLFYGFTPNPSSPISLASNEEYSPRAVRFDFKPFDSSEDDSSAEERALPVLPSKCPQIEQLLDDDEDLFMLAHPSVETRFSPDLERGLEKSSHLTDEAAGSRGGTVPEERHPMPLSVCFATARGSSIKVSESALLKAEAMFAEEGTAMDERRETGSVKLQLQGSSMPKVQLAECSNLPLTHIETNRYHDEMDGAKQLTKPSLGGFSTASGATIAVSKEALAKAQSMFAEEEDQIKNETTIPKGNALPADKMHPVSTKSVGTKHIPSFTGGFSTAGGSKIAVSKEALAKAQSMFDEEEESKLGKENFPGNNVQQAGVGFSTAGGSKIAVSKEALERAQVMFDKEDKLPERNLQHSSVNAVERADTSRNPLSSNVPPSVGFSSAAGKRLQVSETALAKAKALFEQVDQEFDAESGSTATHDVGHRKRKISFSQEEPVTPTKRPRVNRLQSLARFQTSTPASVIAKSHETDSLPRQAPKQSTTTTTTRHEVDQFFAELDDEEFEELFRHQQQQQQQQPEAEAGPRKQSKLLSKFEQCAETKKPPEEEVTLNTSISHWEDSFTDILPKLPADEQGNRPPDDVQRKRREALQKQQQFVDSKPEEMRRPRVSNFCAKKLQNNRMGLEAFVGEGSRPNPAPVTSSAMNVTLDNVMEFRFCMIEYYGETVCNSNTTGVPVGSDGEAVLLMDERSCVGVEEMKVCFLASLGIDPRLVPSGWIENGWRWIVSKLGAMERNLAGHFRGALTPENVFHQLQYRYHVEIDSARRPPLRKVLEKDDTASRRMVLFVASVFRADGTITGQELELSDGWYSVRTVIDAPLAAAVRAGKIAVGTKLMIQGGELLHHKDGCSPLEVPPEVRLRIHANSTRRARWPAKLGYCRCPVPFLTACNSIHDRGGLISRFRALVVRVYPLVYVEKAQNDSHGSVLRSERMHQRHSRRSDASQLDSLHKLYNQIQQEIEGERTATSMNRHIRVSESTPCSQLQDLLEAGLDVSFLDMELTYSQQEVIRRFQQQRQEELQNEINSRVKAQMDQCANGNRSSVTALLKVRLMDHVSPARAFMLSIWRPTDDVRFVMQEHDLLELSTLTANGTKNGDVQLTAHKSTTYTKLSTPTLPSSALGRFTRSITPIGDIDPPSFRPPFNEFDTVGVVVHVGPCDSKKFQSIYLADTAMELLCVNFWHGLAEYACDEVVHRGAVLCVANLQWRTIGRQNQPIAQSFATEYTTFTGNPRSGQPRAEWDRFQLQLDAIDREDFFQRCQERVRELADTPGGTPTLAACSTPYRQRSSMAGVQHSTPLGASGAGSLAKRKMETLATIYGSPPKLSPIVMRSNPILRKGFKTPARLGAGSGLDPASPMDVNGSVG